MASQYAGWQIVQGKYFAMASGPMRAAGSKEPLFAQIGHRETPSDVIGILETRKIPPTEVIDSIATACRVAPEHVTLLGAPTASQAGGLQIVARSIETALHKMHEIGFDLARVASGYGVAPLPPVAADDLAAIGRTNDAILYGGEVTLWVHGPDADIESFGPRIPSNASGDHGQPFRQIFERYNRDFYRVDPHLFSPAVVTLVNLDSGRTFRFGQLLPDVVEQSFTT
jgi:methenyltetrahydromethanopterin cyclohydrolase